MTGDKQMVFGAARDTLQEAKEALRTTRRQKEGTTCPCCLQHAQEYPRKLNASMARWLIALYQEQPDPAGAFCRSSTIAEAIGYRNGGEFSLLKWWMLVDQMENEITAKRVSGLWRITHDGIRFVLGLSRHHRVAHVYNNRLVSFEGPELSIEEALGTSFSYAELMGRECRA